MKRRVELGLVVLAALITVAAYVLVSMGNDASVPANIGPFFAAVLVVFIGAHIATRRLAPNADSLLLPLAILLNGLGYVFIVRVANDVRGAKGPARPAGQLDPPRRGGPTSRPCSCCAACECSIAIATSSWRSASVCCCCR